MATGVARAGAVLRTGPASLQAPNAAPVMSAAMTGRRRSVAVMACLPWHASLHDVARHARIVDREHSVGTVPPDPDVQPEHAKLILALQRHAEEPGWLRRGPERVGPVSYTHLTLP